MEKSLILKYPLGDFVRHKLQYNERNSLVVIQHQRIMFTQIHKI